MFFLRLPVRSVKEETERGTVVADAVNGPDVVDSTHVIREVISEEENGGHAASSAVNLSVERHV